MDAPFLYQTRTILRRCGRPSLISPRQRYLSCSAHIRQDAPEGTSFFRRKAAAVAASNPRNGTGESATLSRQEREAFEQLQRYADRQQINTRLGVNSPELDPMDLDPLRILSLFVPQQQQTPPEQPTTIDDTSHSTHLFEAGAQSPSLRPLSPPELSPAPTVEFVTQQICLGELKEFIKAARQALDSRTQPGDLALYQLLESRVFPLIHVLNSQSKSRKRKNSKAASSTPDAKSTNDDQPNTPTADSSNEPPSPPTPRVTAHPQIRALFDVEELLRKHVPHLNLPTQPDPSITSPTGTNTPASSPPFSSTIAPLQLLTRLYPSLLLYTLRLLAKTHPLSLHTHRLLPQIRALGPSSYILGATTPFYNTHILLRWKVYSSLSEICSLLAEMERGSVDFDRGTSRVLRSMVEERANDLAGRPQAHQQQGRGRQWWLAEEQQRWWEKVEEWRAVIARRLEERGLGEVLREDGAGVGSDGATMGDHVHIGIGGQEIEVPRVWL